MKIKREKLESITNTSITSKKFKLSEDSEATRHIIEILTRNLYSNPQRSAIREVLGNAIDASIENNNKRVDITIKSSEYIESLFFLEIRDYGIGIDEERMDQYVRQIGNSSKRESDEQIGALGIGICTLFCIGEQVFIETSTKDKNITYLLYRDSGGIPCYDIKNIEEREPGETGTNIKVLIDDFDILNKSIRYILENCFLIEVDLYTNLNSLCLLSSWVYKYKIDKEKLNQDLKYINSFYIFPIYGINNKYSTNTYRSTNRFENKGGYKRIEENQSSIEIEKSSKEDNKLFSEELIHYRSYSNNPTKIIDRDIIKSLTTVNNGIIEKDCVIIMMGDSLYTLDIPSLKRIYINDYKSSIEDKDNRIKTIKVIENMQWNGLQLVVRVPIGSIRFSSNRENIVIEDEETREYILNALKECIDKYLVYFLSSNDLNRKIETFKDLITIEKTIVKHDYLFNLDTIYLPHLGCRLSVENRSYINGNIIKSWNGFRIKENEIDNYEKYILFNSEEAKEEWFDKVLRSKDIINHLVDSLDSYLVGPTEVLNIPSDVESNLSSTIPKNTLTKQKLSRIFSNILRYRTKHEVVKEFLEKNNIKIILSTNNSVSEIRNNKSLVEEKEPFLLIVEKDKTVANEIRKSLAYKLLDVKFFKSGKKEKKKKEITIEEKEYKSFYGSLSSCRVLSEEYCNNLISHLENNRYSLERKYDITEKLEENILKENKLNKRIIYTELDNSYTSLSIFFKYWLVDRLCKKGYIKGEEGKINRLLFLTPLSATYLRDKNNEVSRNYKLKYFNQVYIDYLYKLYKKNKIYLDNLLCLGKKKNRSSYPYYFNNNSDLLYEYCITGQIEKLLIKKGVKYNRSLIEICNTEMVKFVISETIKIDIQEKDFIYNKKEFIGLENVINIILEDLRQLILKFYEKDNSPIVSPFNWLLGYNNNETKDIKMIGDYLDITIIPSLEDETGKLNEIIEELIDKLF